MTTPRTGSATLIEGPQAYPGCMFGTSALTPSCSDSEQASHNGDLAHAVAAERVARDDVTQLGDVLAGKAEGRRNDDEITVFDSTGLAIQDLAIALAALERVDELNLPHLEL
jgi:alanine dehydrogenase